MVNPFKIPEIIPQDILLIKDLVGEISPVTVDTRWDTLRQTDEDSVDSSSSEGHSEDEVEADLLATADDIGGVSSSRPIISASDSDSDSAGSSDSDSSSSESDVLSPTIHDHDIRKPQFDLDDEESGPAPTAYTQTKNEVVDGGILVPSISEVDSNEILEKVGEIISIVGNVVIIKGTSAEAAKLISERVLDTETLLVFDDRKVLGHIHETFGPTSQPLYQVKFDREYPLDTEKVRVSRDVYHVPRHSKFVFVDYLKKLRGSDASNIHDEEPAEEELEFSDDEQEAAFKNRRKRRGQSVSSSRQTTPGPSRPHYDDMGDGRLYGSNPYDAHGPYDEDFCAPGPSRPPPIPYDDPYANESSLDTLHYEDSQGSTQVSPQSTSAPSQWQGDKESRAGKRGRGRGRGGRGGRGRWSHDRDDRNYRSRGRTPQDSTRSIEHGESTHTPQSLYTAMEHTTSQVADELMQYQSMQHANTPLPWSSVSLLHGGMNYHQQQQQQHYVQPHINPRFASAFGFNMHMPPPQWQGYNYGEQPQPQYQPAESHQSWTDEWNVHVQGSDHKSGGDFPPG